MGNMVSLSIVTLEDGLIIDVVELVQLLLIEHVGHDDVALSRECVTHRVVHLPISL